MYSYDQIEFATVAVVALIAIAVHAVVAFICQNRRLFLLGMLATIGGSFSPGILVPYPIEIGHWFSTYLLWRDALIQGTVLCSAFAYLMYFSIHHLKRRCK